MQTPPIPANERERLEALRRLAVLDTPVEVEFDRFTRLAARLFDVPIALITFIDSERQWFKSTVGIGVRQTPRSASFCGHTILEPGLMVVPDATHDARFHDNPIVSGPPHVRFYAGAPLRTADGFSIGTLCIIDSKPRELSGTQRELLNELGALVMEQLHNRHLRRLAEEESQQLRALLAALPAPVTVHQDGDVVFANAAAEDVLRVAPGALVGHSARNFLVPKTQTANSSDKRIERRLRTGDGEEILVESTPIPMHWRGEPALVVLHRDVSAQRREEEARRKATDLLAEQLNEMLVIFDGLPEGVAVTDSQTRCIYANHALGKFFGMNHEDILGWTSVESARRIAECSEDPEATLKRMDELFMFPAGGSRSDTFVFVKPRKQVLRRTVHHLGLTDRPWIIVWTDITVETEQLQQSQIAAATDQLTLLPNRRAAENDLKRALAAGGPVSVVLFDIDHFKKVNDTFGHDIGDAVLVAVAGALRKSTRSLDFVARWGGEEFLAVVRSDETGARLLAERVRRAVSELSTPAGPVTLSGGVALVQDPGDVKRADAQLYEAKRQGRNRVLG